MESEVEDDGLENTDSLEDVMAAGEGSQPTTEDCGAVATKKASEAYPESYQEYERWAYAEGFHAAYQWLAERQGGISG